MHFFLCSTATCKSTTEAFLPRELLPETIEPLGSNTKTGSIHVRFFLSKKRKRQELLKALAPCMLYFLIGPYKGRRPRKPQRKAYLLDGLKRNLRHYGLEYDKEEGEYFAEQILEQAKAVEHSKRNASDFALNFTDDFTFSLICDDPVRERIGDRVDKEGFEIC